MSKRSGGALLSVTGIILGVIGLVVAFRPVENFWGQNCGSVFAPENTYDIGFGDSFLDRAAFDSACPDAIAPYLAWTWFLLVAACLTLLVGAVLFATATQAPGGNSSPTVASELERLEALQRSGALTDEEFVRAKGRIIGTGTDEEPPS